MANDPSFITKNFLQRLAIGSCSAVVVVVAILIAPSPLFGPIFAALVTGIASVALWEYYQVAERRGYKPVKTIGLVTNVAFLVAAYLSSHYLICEGLPVVVVGLFGFSIFCYYLYDGAKPMENLAISAFGIGYITFPLSSIIFLTYLFPDGSTHAGNNWLLYVITVTKLTDVGAYFSGKALGKHRLAPVLSPKKTIEGALIGVLCAVITSLLFYYAYTSGTLPGLHITFSQAVWVGLAISITAQIGDLSESLIKRDAGVKDSSHLPGLGGILDIVDSVIFTIPLVYILVYCEILAVP